MLTQDCAALVLGYYPISLREKDRCRFHLSRVGNAGGGLLQSLEVLCQERVLPQPVKPVPSTEPRDSQTDSRVEISPKCQAGWLARVQINV
jgi:hypothetical protein